MERRVEDVGGGGDVCDDCVTIAGTVLLNAGGGTLTGSYVTGSQSIFSPYEFSYGELFEGPVFLSGTGRFANFSGNLVLFVSPGRARVVVQFQTTAGNFEARGEGAPRFEIQRTSQCSSNQLLETRVRLHLEHLGNTELIDRHCIAVP